MKKEKKKKKRNLFFPTEFTKKQSFKNRNGGM